MRGDVVYRVYGLHEGREEDLYFGTFRSRSEADAEIAKLLCVAEMNGRNWAKQYHNKGFVVRETVVTVDFEIPSQPKPRDKYVVKGLPTNRPGTWDTTIIEVFRRTSPSGGLEKICEYERNYSLLRTFKPFRQGSRDFALISRDYTRTAVLDLESGSVIAEEMEEPGASSGAGFCPVGFYVPDWWDVNGGSVIPGSEYWSADREWPNGDFGLVWGCYWGDDSSWKVQYLDLSRVQQGVVRRDERFWISGTGDVRFRESLFQTRRGDSEKPSSALYPGLEAKRDASGEVRCRDEIRSRIWKVAGMQRLEIE
jgi:hypothetical protein